jgi:hypothetical protein
MTDTQKQTKLEQTKWCYLCTFGVTFQGIGAGTMLGAYSKLMNRIPRIERELKERGWDVKQTTCDEGGHYFNKVFFNTYEAKMSGSKSRDISRGILEKIASKHDMKLL